MEKEQQQQQINQKYSRLNYFFVPLAIIIAGAMISGAVVYSSKYKSNLKEGTKKVVLSETNQKEEIVGQKRVKVSQDDDPQKGNDQAKVVIIEFSDFQCPYCARATATVKQIEKTYGDKIKFVYRDFPLSFHKNALKAAQAAECADDQGKFWEYHDLLFEKQAEWRESEEVNKIFKKYGKDLNLNSKEFDKCLDSEKYKDEVLKDQKDGQAAGVEGTPAFFVNGRLISGAQPFSVFQKVIDEELKK